MVGDVGLEPTTR